MSTFPAPARRPPEAQANPLAVVVPVRTVSEANAHQQFRHRQKRARGQRSIVAMYLRPMRRMLPELPVVITLTRLAPRELDWDNAVSSMKAVIDQIAAEYGVDDRDPRYTWRVRQEKSKSIGVRIEIVPASLAGGGGE
jgi:hypothetical protein